MKILNCQVAVCGTIVPVTVQTTVASKNDQVEELQSKLEKKNEIVKELDSQKDIRQDG